MVITKLKRWTLNAKPLCFSCGEPTKTVTKTCYGLLPFCYSCAELKRKNRKLRTHILYGRDFKTEIGEPAQIERQTPKQIMEEIRSKQLPTETLKEIIRNQQITMIRGIMKKYNITIDKISNAGT